MLGKAAFWTSNKISEWSCSECQMLSKCAVKVVSNVEHIHVHSKIGRVLFVRPRFTNRRFAVLVLHELIKFMGSLGPF